MKKVKGKNNKSGQVFPVLMIVYFFFSAGLAFSADFFAAGFALAAFAFAGFFGASFFSSTTNLPTVHATLTETAPRRVSLRLSHRHHLRQSIQLFPVQRDQFRAKPQNHRRVDGVTTAQAVVRGDLTGKIGNCVVKIDQG